MPKILEQIEHIVVVMLENRSFDNMCGWLYPDPQNPPKQFLPPGAQERFEGLRHDLFNPADASYFEGKPCEKYPIFLKANAMNMPNPDPKRIIQA